MTKYEKAAAKAVDNYLRSHRYQATVKLHDLSLVADEAAFAAGKKRELYASLYDYERVLPKKAVTLWTRNGFYCVVNPYSLKSGETLAAETAAYVPGPFDTCVDMGPDSCKTALKEERGV